MLKGGGGTKSFGVVFIRQLEVLAILKGGAQKDSTLLKGGGSLSCIDGGGAKSFGAAIFPFCSPLLPAIIDQSLNVTKTFL